ncbi:MAG: YciI family protein [Tepidamorphaceae bacterium]
MFAVFLRFAENKAKAGAFMDGHKAWLQTGFNDGIFLAAGSLQDPDGGGAILAHNASRDELQTRVNEDPFVAENVVSAEIVEFVPSRTDDRLAFLAN